MRHRNWTTPWEQLYVFAWRIACFLDVFHGWSGYRFDCDNWQISEVPQPSWNAASLVLVVGMAGANFHTDCFPGRRITDDLQRQYHQKSRHKMPACLSWWSWVIRVFALFLSELKLLRFSLVASFCNKAFKNFAFVINGAPKVTRSPFIFTKTSFRCHYQFECCPVLFLRISPANFDPKRSTQNQTVSWQISIPRSCKTSSTWRKLNG